MTYDVYLFASEPNPNDVKLRPIPPPIIIVKHEINIFMCKRYIKMFGLVSSGGSVVSYFTPYCKIDREGAIK